MIRIIILMLLLAAASSLQAASTVSTDSLAEREIGQRFAEMKSAYERCDGSVLATLVDQGIGGLLIDGASAQIIERTLGGFPKDGLTFFASNPLGRTSFGLSVADADFDVPNYGWATFLSEDCKQHRATYSRLFGSMQIGKMTVADADAASLIGYTDAPNGAVLFWRHDGKRWNPGLSKLFVDFFDPTETAGFGDPSTPVAAKSKSARDSGRAEFVERYAAYLVSDADAADRAARAPQSTIEKMRPVDVSALPNAAGSYSANSEFLRSVRRLSAEGGNTEAAVALAYEADDLNTRDGFVEAARWLTLAAQGGNGDAQDLLGLYYQDGRGGLDADCRLAIHWLELAVDGGRRQSTNNLAWVLATSRDSACRDAKRAQELLAAVDVNSEPEQYEVDTFAGMLDTLAAIRCELNQIEEAIALQKRVVQYLPTDSKKLQRLKMYQTGICWRGGSVYPAEPESAQ